MKRKNIVITNANGKLFGTLFLPAREGEHPAVIFSHGYNGSGKDFEKMGEYLVENGVAAFCYDFCGGSVHSRSSMATTDMTIFTEKEDLQSVITYAKQCDEIDSRNLFIFGGSQGGLVSALAAESKKEDIRGMVLLFPAMCIADNWNERYPKEEDIPETQEFWGMELGKNFFLSLRGFDAFQNIGTYQKPVLVICGENDPIVPPEHMERLKSVYADMELKVFPNEGHGFSEAGNQKVAEMTLEFVRQNRR